MIKEFSVRPTPQNSNAKIAFSVTLALAAVGFIIYMIMDEYRALVGFIALLILVTAILIYTKYIAPVFCYDIMIDTEGTPLFVVRQIIGKRQSTFCRIALHEITSITREDKEQRRAHKTPRGTRRYTYAPTLFPSVTYRIASKTRYESAEIVIEGTEEFIALLDGYTKEARALYISEE